MLNKNKPSLHATYFLYNSLLKFIIYLNGTFSLSIFILSIVLLFSANNNKEKFANIFVVAGLAQAIFIGYIIILGLRILTKKRSEKNLFEIKNIEKLMLLGSFSYILLFILNLIFPSSSFSSLFYQYSTKLPEFLSKVLFFVFIISIELILIVKIIYHFFDYNVLKFFKNQFDLSTPEKTKSNEPALVYFPICLLICLTYVIFNFIQARIDYSILNSKIIYYMFGFTLIYLHLSYLTNYFKLKFLKNKL